MAKLIELRAGCCVRAKVSPTYRQAGRSQKLMRTSSWQDHFNIKYSAQKFELLLECNFDLKDYCVELTYDQEHLPPNADAAIKRLKKFIRQMRQSRKSRGVPLKYVYVTEGLHGDHRLHHHLVIDRQKGDLELIRNLWPDGRVHMCQLSRWGYSGAAAYLTKEPRKNGRVHVGDHMWSASTNLARPTAIVREVPDNYRLEVPEQAYEVYYNEKATPFGGRVTEVSYRLPWKYRNVI